MYPGVVPGPVHSLSCTTQPRVHTVPHTAGHRTTLLVCSPRCPGGGSCQRSPSCSLGEASLGGLPSKSGHASSRIFLRYYARAKSKN